jgi:hypothetical protein
MNGTGISLLVPYRDDGAVGRRVNWAWLKRFWDHALPDAEMIVGVDRLCDPEHDMPFSKTCAVNDAFQRSTGDVIVLLDADCFIAPKVILDCARAIREARTEVSVGFPNGEPLWFVPYEHLFRLTEASTAALIASDPNDALEFPEPPKLTDVGPTIGANIGHRFGALIQIMPREAFIAVGGMDPRFRGWGGEDVTFLRVVDTIYGQHRTTQNQVLTLWHTAFGNIFLRMWGGQGRTGINNVLSVHYRKAVRDRTRMRAVIDEWRTDPAYASHLI